MLTSQVHIKVNVKRIFASIPPLDLLEIHLWIYGSVSMVASRSQWNICSLSGIRTNMPRNLRVFRHLGFGHIIDLKIKFNNARRIRHFKNKFLQDSVSASKFYIKPLSVSTRLGPRLSENRRI